VGSVVSEKSSRLKRHCNIRLFNLFSKSERAFAVSHAVSDDYQRLCTVTVIMY
jgi:hypothetical protein